jgi:hypothetical protein
MSVGIWLCSIVHDVERARLERIMQTWAVPGIAGICVITDQDVPVVHERQRVVRTTWPFSRSTWRNLAVRWAPAEWVVMVDADCMLTDQFTASLELLAPGRMVVHVPWWMSERASAAWLATGEIDCTTIERPRATLSPWAGTVGLARTAAVQIGWDDNMRTWGYEDLDFVERRGWARLVREPAEGVTGAMLHVWHPSRPDRCRMSRVANARIAHERAAEFTPERATERALSEIVMCEVSPSVREDFVARVRAGEPVERTARALAMNLALWTYSSGGPLARGEVPARCTYSPMLACRVTDS